jgi:hypothetical protein
MGGLGTVPCMSLYSTPTSSVCDTAHMRCSHLKTLIEQNNGALVMLSPINQ